MSAVSTTFLPCTCKSKLAHANPGIQVRRAGPRPARSPGEPGLPGSSSHIANSVSTVRPRVQPRRRRPCLGEMAVAANWARDYQRVSSFVTGRTWHKRRGVIRGPLAKRSWRQSEDVEHRRRDERGPSHRCAPRGDQHVHHRARPASRRLVSKLVRRQLLKFDPTPHDVTDDAYLLCLTKRLGACEDVVASGMSVLIKGP